ncbi:alpha/beta hydrolase, partial [Micromonospora sp. DT48]
MSAGEVLERLELEYREDAVRARVRDGVELYYESTGSGPVVLTLNNFFMTTPAWRVVTDELSVAHRVVS